MGKKSAQQAIVFYDGFCALCNSSVQFLLRIDKKSRLQFAPLQGETAQQLLPPSAIVELNSMVFLKEGILYKNSSAILHLLKSIGGIWQVFYCFILLPEKCRDAVYKFIARNRYKWFGKYESCKMPTEKDKSALLK